MSTRFPNTDERKSPQRPESLPELMTPVEAAMFLRLDHAGHTPEMAKCTLNYWQDSGQHRAIMLVRSLMTDFFYE